jgi:uncharacterized protein YceH (UPF0502 family)
MTDLVPGHPPATVKWQPLDPEQRRVLGVLIEKAKTTPAGYPMSESAIVTACNQKSNRDPVMNLDDFTVGRVLTEMVTMGAVSEVDWVGRVSKWKHHAYEWLGVTKPEIAVMTELLLRGAQTLGDLRVRASRMEPIEDLAALRPIVDALVARRLMIELTPAGRGQIVSHGLYLPGELAGLMVQTAGGGAPGPAAHSEADVHRGGLATEVAALREEVERLREEVRELKARLAPN